MVRALIASSRVNSCIIGSKTVVEQFETRDR